MSNSKRRAFVIMPFADDLAWVFDDVLAPLLRETDYEAVRADTTLNQRNLLADIVIGIAECDIIIADLTGANPNVMYELGLAHGLRRPVVMLTQDISTAPFDLRAYRLNPYTERYPDVEALKNVLRQALEAHTSGEVAFGSPIDDFLPTERENDSVQLSALEQNEVLPSDDAPLGLIDHEEIFIELGQSTSQHMEKVAERANQFAHDLNSITQELQGLRADDPAIPQKRRRLSTLVAQAVDAYASDLQNSTSPLLEYWSAMESALNAILNTSTITTQQDVKAAQDLILLLNDFTAELKSASDAVLSSRGDISTLKSLSRELGRAVPRLERAMSSMMSAIDLGAAFSDRTKRLLERRIRDFEEDQ